MHNILIVGAGQLGSRYLQGLSEVSIPLNIIVLDVSSKSLLVAAARWQEVVKVDTPHTVSFINEYHLPVNEIEIAIVATGASNRHIVIKNILEITTIRYWILEKVLAQSSEGIETIKELLKEAKGAWVNTPRRVMKWWKEIKSMITTGQPLQLSIEGGLWGLACNSIHFLDLLQWITEEQLISVDVKDLKKEWFESKRQGYYEVKGSISCYFSGGSLIQLSVDPKLTGMKIHIKEKFNSWEIDESSGTAIRSDGLTIIGGINFQSELTNNIVQNILLNGMCGLPTLNQSSELHKPFLNDMLKHWKKQEQKTEDKYLPIT